MDYGKFKYQQSKRNHVARQNQKVVHLKEVKMKPKIEEHDFQFKLRSLAILRGILAAKWFLGTSQFGDFKGHFVLREGETRLLRARFPLIGF